MNLEVRLQRHVGDFTLDCEFRLAGGRTGIFGPSGSGKSSLMQLLAGLTAADAGHIRLDGDTLFDSNRGINVKPEQRRVGVVFQHAHLFPHYSVEQNALYGFRRTASPERRLKPDDVFRMLGIDRLAGRRVTTLSGGERQRVALARTVLACPRLIVMDEPLTGLDHDSKFQIIPYLNRVLDEYAIPLIFISHSLLEMRMMTEEVVIMADGRVQQQTATETLARTSWATGRTGYTNLLSLGPSQPHHDLFSYQWGENRLILTEPGQDGENLFELDAREIILFKQHPQATSARNLLRCRVTKIFTSGNRVRVELSTGGCQLIAQIVPESVRELEIAEGSEVVAAIKASSFIRLY